MWYAQKFESLVGEVAAELEKDEAALQSKDGIASVVTVKDPTVLNQLLKNAAHAGQRATQCAIQAWKRGWRWDTDGELSQRRALFCSGILF